MLTLVQSVLMEKYSQVIERPHKHGKDRFIRVYRFYIILAI